MRRHFLSAAVLLIASILIALPTFAQKITGDITGDVTDTTGAVLPNVTITVLNVDTGISRTANTSSSGNFRVPDLAIGNYKVTATAQGFKTLVQTVQIQ